MSKAPLKFVLLIHPREGSDLATLLEESQCVLDKALSMEEALQLVSKRPPHLIVIVPGAPGFRPADSIRLLRTYAPQSRIIVVLTPSEVQANAMYTKAGADHCYVADSVAEIKHAMDEELVRVGETKILPLNVFDASPVSHPSGDMPPLWKPDHLILHYRILSKIGHGAMGEVYKAADLRLGRIVAIKVLHGKVMRDESARMRLLQEARTASALNHPNIVTIHSIEETDGHSFIVMELVEGETLREKIEKSPLEILGVLDIGSQICDALDAAHGVGLIHRDIKPGNIMITSRGQAKLLDFGLAKRMESWMAPMQEDRQKLTEEGVVIGTVSYMSPEQTQGRNLNAPSDIFSLGTVLYEAATGKVAFDAPTILGTFHSIVSEDPPAPSTIRENLPPEFDYIIRNTLAKDAAARYSQAAELAEALRRLKTQIQESSSGSFLPAGVPVSGGNELKRLVVLYFENLTGGKEDEYLRDGLTEDVITELSKIQEIRVFPRSVALAYRDKQVTADQIGRRLNATLVLAGSMRRAEDRVRINVQLVEAQSGHTVWGDRYDRKLTDIFDLQEEIARSIAQALRITLTPQEESAIAFKATENPQAYDYYLRGRNYTRRATRADLEFAIEMFEKSQELEPQFALAHAGLANVCGLFHDWYEHEDVWLHKGLAAAERALALQPELPEGLAARGRIYWGERKYEEAVSCCRMALERKVDCEGAYWVLGLALFALGRNEEGVALIDRALEACGDDYNTYVPLINILGCMNAPEEIDKLRKQQMRVLKQQLQWVPEDVRARMLLSTNYAYFGNKREAVRELEKAVALRPSDANLLYNAACTYAVLGITIGALEHLKLALNAGFNNLDWVSRDPDLAGLHSDPEFQKLVKGNH